MRQGAVPSEDGWTPSRHGATLFSWSFVYFGLRKGFLHGLGWTETYRNPPACASRGLRLPACVATHGSEHYMHTVATEAGGRRWVPRRELPWRSLKMVLTLCERVLLAAKPSLRSCLRQVLKLQQSSCLRLPSDRITGMSHPAQLECCQGC